jgi:hypothetical protein
MNFLRQIWLLNEQVSIKPRLPRISLGEITSAKDFPLRHQFKRGRKRQSPTAMVICQDNWSALNDSKLKGDRVLELSGGWIENIRSELARDHQSFFLNDNKLWHGAVCLISGGGWDGWFPPSLQLPTALNITLTGYQSQRCEDDKSSYCFRI